MQSQNRYIEGESDSLTTGGQHVNEIKVVNSLNVHGLVVDINIESEAMDANSNGFWIVFAFPGDIINALDFPQSYAQIDDERLQGYIWGFGNWMASNQTPFHTQFRPKTSRNLPRQGRIICYVFVNGTLPLLSGNRINSIISFFAGK